jgi:hypothetical protein
MCWQNFEKSGNCVVNWGLKNEGWRPEQPLLKLVWWEKRRGQLPVHREDKLMAAMTFSRDRTNLQCPERKSLGSNFSIHPSSLFALDVLSLSLTV